ALKLAASDPNQTADSLEQASREVREATERFNHSNIQLKQAPEELKQAAAELGVATEMFNGEADRLKGEVEGVLGRVVLIDVEEGDKEWVLVNGIKERIWGYEGERSRSAMLELIEFLAEHSSDLGGIMGLKDE
ncbi:hypothetical protein V491_03284, partial [Pseudogymnoascus sp. VKM F-3775]